MPTTAERPAARRLALVVATETYADETLAKLRAPGRDAAELAAVLRDAAIGAFEVEAVLDAPAESLRRRIAQFCAQLGPHDLALIYLSCHGVLDDRGRLYYATTDTARELLSATAVSAAWLNEQLEDCRARRQILVLDCCHSGAFAKGAKGAGDLSLRERFEGRGRVVLTGSRATEYSFEHGHVVGEAVSSVFTRALVEGLRSGEADRDGDGIVTVSELYDHVYEAVRAKEARQTPTLWSYGAEGELLVAHSPRGAVVKPVPLPEDLTAALESARPKVRAGAVAELADLLAGADAGRALTARTQLERVAAEDAPSVAAVAREALDAAPIATRASTPRSDQERSSLAAPTNVPPTPPSTGAATGPPSSSGTGSRRPADPPLRARRRTAAIVVAAALVVLMIALLTDGGTRPRAPKPAPSAITLLGSPRGVAVGEGATWVTHYDRDEVSRIGPSERIESIYVGAKPGKIVAGEGAVWVGIDDGKRLVRIDPDTPQRVPKLVIDLEADGCRGCAITELSIAQKTLWVGSAGQRAIRRFDLSTGAKVGAPYKPGVGFKGVFAVNGDSVWAVATDSRDPPTSAVVRIDRDTYKPEPFPLRKGSFFNGLAYGRQTLWIADAAEAENVVTAFNTVSHKVTKNIPLEASITGDDIAFADGKVLVWDPGGGQLTQINAKTKHAAPPQKVPKYRTGKPVNNASDLAVGGGFAWVTDPAGDAVHKVAY
jgi:hypothetical protein